MCGSPVPPPVPRGPLPRVPDLPGPAGAARVTWPGFALCLVASERGEGASPKSEEPLKLEPEQEQPGAVM